ncbi:hypothetical protein KM043_008932 [Ampulex compressa]|nr:hypothetical protein KM043_008932 [Ampulex compressa]
MYRGTLRGPLWSVYREGNGGRRKFLLELGQLPLRNRLSVGVATLQGLRAKSQGSETLQSWRQTWDGCVTAVKDKGVVASQISGVNRTLAIFVATLAPFSGDFPFQQFDKDRESRDIGC